MAIATFDLANLDGIDGFVLEGIDNLDGSGASVSGAGDINGDGLDDLIIGASGADPNGNSVAGESYVVFGSDEGFAASLNLANLDGSNGFVLEGIDERNFLGSSVSGAGDINGDGLDDLIIGASGADPNGNSYAGESYVVFGSDEAFAASLNLANLDGSNGFVLEGIDERNFLGSSVSGAGDINGDGLDDLIIGAFGADPNGNYGAGESYVVFGSDEAFAASLNLANLDGSNGFALEGIDEYDGSGLSVSGAGDINGDGLDDLIIGASGADPNGNSVAGESYVVFGSDEGFAASLNLANLDGSNGFALEGIDNLDSSGLSVSGAGDINGDGLDDLIIGAFDADSNGNYGAGESYVVFGSDEGFAASLNLANLDGSNGFALEGIDEYDGSGLSVSGAGDINGDDLDDLIIGAPTVSLNGNFVAGESYVVFGSDEGFAASLNLANLDGSNGFALEGIDEYDRSGASVSGAGDINGDGLDDLIIGAPAVDLNGNYGAGESYVVFGFRSLLGTLGDDTLDGTNSKDLLAGLEADDLLMGSDGDDVLRGDLNSRNSQVRIGGNDTLFGGVGNDRLGGKGGNDQLFGEAGRDQLWGDGGNDTLRGGLGNDRLVGDDFSGGQGNDLFVLAPGEGTDTIVDFEDGEDQIGLAERLTFPQLTISARGSNVSIALGSETLALLNNVAVGDLTQADFVVV